MDRSIVYPGQIPLESDFLAMQQASMVGMGYAAQTTYGTTTCFDGLTVIPNVPASLAVQVLPGSLYALRSVEATPFGSLPQNLTEGLVKQGILHTTTLLTLTPPATAGQSINYLIQGTLSEVDAVPVTLPYYNSANPAQPYTGPNNSGVAQNTKRNQTIVVSAKAGAAATSGTQVTPAADAGYIPLYVVTVAQGATQLTGGQIVIHPTAPLVTLKLPQVPSWVQGGSYQISSDTGTANAMVVTLTPAPLALTAGLTLFVRKMAASNTGAMTVNVNGLGAVAVVDQLGAPLAANAMPANFRSFMQYDGSAFIFLNSNVTNTTVSSISASSGEGVTVGGTTPFPVSLNFPGLTNNPTPTASDIFAFHDAEGPGHRGINWTQLLAAIKAANPRQAVTLVTTTNFDHAINAAFANVASLTVNAVTASSPIIANTAGAIELTPGKYKVSAMGQMSFSGTKLEASVVDCAIAVIINGVGTVAQSQMGMSVTGTSQGHGTTVVTPAVTERVITIAGGQTVSLAALTVSVTGTAGTGRLVSGAHITFERIE